MSLLRCIDLVCVCLVVYVCASLLCVHRSHLCVFFVSLFRNVCLFCVMYTGPLRDADFVCLF